MRKTNLGIVAIATAVLLSMFVNVNSDSSTAKLKVAEPLATIKSITGDLITFSSNL